MQEVYEDEEELQPVELRRDAHDTHDTDVTLGPMRLVGIFCGLVLVCGLCFGLRCGAPQRAATSTGRRRAAR